METRIVCGVIASPSPIYDAYKVQWLELIRRVKAQALPVDFYFLYNSGSAVAANEVCVEAHEFHTDLFFPFQETVIPGILQKTMAFYRWLGAQNVPYTHLIRSNMSSFFRFDRLLAIMEEHDAKDTRTVLAHMIEGRYPTGCGALFGREIIEEFVDRFGSIDVSTNRLYDDQVLGEYLRQISDVHVHGYEYVCLSNLSKEEANEQMKRDHFHYRTKYLNHAPGMEGVEYFRLLTNMYYPTTMQTPTNSEQTV